MIFDAHQKYHLPVFLGENGGDLAIDVEKHDLASGIGIFHSKHAMRFRPILTTVYGWSTIGFP